MNELKPSTSDGRKSRVAFWGTVTQAGILLLVSSSVLLLTILALTESSVDFNSTGTFIALEVAVVMTTMVAMEVLSLVFTFRGNQEFGYRLVYSSVVLFVLNTTLLIQGQAFSMSFLLLILSALGIGWLCPSESRRNYIITTGTAFVLAWIIEWINPPWRESYSGAQVGPIGTIIFVFVFAILVASLTWGRSLRNKLLIGFIGVALVTSGTLAAYVHTSTNNILQQSLEKELTQHTHGVADQVSALLNEQVNTVLTLSLNEVLQQTVDELNKTYEGDAGTIQATLETRDAQWRTADAADNNYDPLVRQYLTNQAALELKEFQKAFPDNAEIFITDVYGGQAGTTNRTSDYLQSDEGWWQAAYNNGQGAVYISEPEYDESANIIALLIAVPLRNRETGRIIGILRTTYQVSALNSILTETLGTSGETDIIFPGEVAYYLHEGGYALIDTEMQEQVQAVADQGLVEMNFDGVDSIVFPARMYSPKSNPAVNNLNWMVVFHQSQEEAYAPVNAQLRGALIVVSLVLILAILAAVVLSTFLVRPISQLTQTAEQVASGNLNTRAKVTGKDEVGTLASTFNSMTSQLQETLSGLEQRVAARTRDLAIVAEVGTATATILESKRLLQEVVDLTKERFNLYHSHIYLLDEEGKNLVLAAGAGEPGRIMAAEKRSIPLGREQSLVARAARERKGVTVNDVTQAPDFLPNPLLPDTRSELAVPMIVGGTVIGVFDIQSDQVGRFTESDVNIQTTLAAQLATSIQNVRSFEQSKKQADLQSLVNLIGSRIQRTTSIEETLQTAIRELGTAIGATRVSVNVQAGQDKEASRN